MDSFTLVTGSEGLVGSRFIEISSVKNTLHYPRQIEMDILDPSQVSAIVKSYDFQAIVNFAAYTNVSGAEKQSGKKDGECWRVNVEGTTNLANALKEKGGNCRFVQISTDMVFPGSAENSGPYPENHSSVEDASKLTWYGYSKSQAEKVVLDTLGDCASILRISYPVRLEFGEKLDYLRKHLSLFNEGKLYPLFTDQKFSISYIDEVCRAVDKIIMGNHKGIYHATSTDTTTPFNLVSYMLEKMGKDTSQLKKTTISEFVQKSGDSPSRFPRFGGLKVEKTQEKLDMKFSDWKGVVETLVNQGLGAEKIG